MSYIKQISIPKILKQKLLYQAYNVKAKRFILCLNGKKQTNNYIGNKCMEIISQCRNRKEYAWANENSEV